MATTQETMAREALDTHRARQPDPDDSSDALSAPYNEDDDDKSNPPNQDGDFAPVGLETSMQSFTGT